MKIKSEKNYATAVCLSAILGLFGIQHFYLGRYVEGSVDVLLTVAWVYFFFNDHLLYGIIMLGLDGLHSFVATILLLTGSYTDGKGQYVCYPGQTL